MSSGHDTDTVTVHTPHGDVLVDVLCVWVCCDGCGELIGDVVGVLAKADASCDSLAANAGWTQDEAERDLCPACGGGAR